MKISCLEKTAENFVRFRDFFIENDALFPDPFSAHVDLNEYAGKLFRYAVIVAAEDETGELCGVVSTYMNDAETHLAHLQMIVVSGRAQNKGVGRRLLEAVRQYADEYGMHAVRLAVDRENLGAEHLYYQMGFVDDETPHPNGAKKYMIMSVKERSSDEGAIRERGADAAAGDGEDDMRDPGGA